MPKFKTNVPGVIGYSNDAGEVIAYYFTTKVKDPATGKYKNAPNYKVSADNYKDMTPKKRDRELQKDFEGWKEQQKHEAEITGPKVIKDITVEDFVNNYWIPNCVDNRTLAYNTKSFYKGNAKHVVAYFKDRKVTSIDTLAALQFSNYLQENIKSGTTQEDIFQRFNSILEFAVQVELIDRNPCVTLKPEQRPHRKRNHKVDIFTAEELKKFIEILDESPIFWKSYGYVLLLTGMRRGEASALQWQDVDFKNAEITVKKSLDKEGTKTTKTDDERVVPMSKQLEAILQELKQAQANRFETIPTPAAFLFSRKGIKKQIKNGAIDAMNKPMYHTSPTKWFAKLGENNGLHIYPHKLRHMAASIMAHNGVPEKEAQRILGHKDGSTITQYYYIEATPEGKREAVEVLAEKALS